MTTFALSGACRCGRTDALVIASPEYAHRLIAVISQDP